MNSIASLAQRRDGAALRRVVGPDEHGHRLRVISEVADVKVGLLARNHRLELGNVVVVPETENGGINTNLRLKIKKLNLNFAFRPSSYDQLVNFDINSGMM